MWQTPSLCFLGRVPASLRVLGAVRKEGVGAIIPGTPNRPRAHTMIGDSLFYDLPRVRLDGGARAFRRRWGYELTPPPTLVEEENEDDPYALPNDDGDNLSYTETRSLREDYLFHSSQGKA
nr:uncharacterized protein LOC113804847 [Penaeus vannamei]